MLQVRDFPSVTDAFLPWSVSTPDALRREPVAARSDARLPPAHCRIVAVTADDRMLMLRQPSPSRLEFPTVGVRGGETCEEAVRRKLRDCADVDCEAIESLGTYHGTRHVYVTGAALIDAPPARGPDRPLPLLLPFSRLLQWIDTGGFDIAQALSFGLALVRRTQAQSGAAKLAEPGEID